MTKADGSPRIHYRLSETSANYLLNSSNAQHSTCAECMWQQKVLVGLIIYRLGSYFSGIEPILRMLAYSTRAHLSFILPQGFYSILSTSLSPVHSNTE